MKFTLDTKNKSITLVECASVGEFIDNMKTLFPQEWRKFKIETPPSVAWQNPIYIEDLRHWYKWYTPLQFNRNTLEFNGSTLDSTVFCVEVGNV